MSFSFSKSPPQVKIFYDPFHEDEVLKMEKIAIIQISTTIQYDFQITAALLITRHFWYLKICLLILTNQFFYIRALKLPTYQSENTLNTEEIFSLSSPWTNLVLGRIFAASTHVANFPLFFSSFFQPRVINLCFSCCCVKSQCLQNIAESVENFFLVIAYVSTLLLGKSELKDRHLYFLMKCLNFIGSCRFCFWHRNFFFRKLPVFKVDILKVEELSEANRLHWNNFFCQSMIFRLALWCISSEVWIRFPGLNVYHLENDVNICIV